MRHTDSQRESGWGSAVLVGVSLSVSLVSAFLCVLCVSVCMCVHILGFQCGLGLAVGIDGPSLGSHSGLVRQTSASADSQLNLVGVPAASLRALPGVWTDGESSPWALGISWSGASLGSHRGMGRCVCTIDNPVRFQVVVGR